MQNVAVLGVVMLSGVLLAGCQSTSIKTQQASASLQPMAERMPQKGDVWRYKMADGTSAEQTAVAVTATTVSWKDTSGCAWTKPSKGFGPSLKWSGCGGADGTQTATRSGNIYPLKVGSSEQWTVQGSNNAGNDWHTTRSCEVTGTAHITVPAGSFDTYHVVCSDNWTVREWFKAPALKTTVLYEKHNRAGGGTERDELVKWIPAGG